MSILGIWKIVFRKKSYLALAFIFAILFYVLNSFLSNIFTLISFYDSFGFLKTFEFFVTLTLGFHQTILLHSLISLILIGIMFGMLISLVVFKTKMNSNFDKKTGFFGSVGAFLGVLIPGCAACGLGLAPLIGISGSLILALPFDGIEISILAIAIVGFVLHRTTKGLLECKNCKNYMVKKIKMKGGKNNGRK